MRGRDTVPGVGSGSLTLTPPTLTPPTLTPTTPDPNDSDPM
jgi:hypothetical protein